MASSTTTFSGTSLSGEHIGTAPSRRAAALLKDETKILVQPSLGTPGAESANAIPVEIGMVDADGNELDASVVLACEVIPNDSGNFTLSETGDGTELSTSAATTLLIQTSSNGEAEVTVTDASGSSTETVFLRVTVVDRLGGSETASMTFA